ncbi:hypothetical protein HUB98_26430 [Paenibacillus barcinonensis]|uniref:Uncharacterized protein n=1 Tax=Paenibacillus barcinonensis TaxID=198119 RepID=A0ABX6QBP7_PAEBA|nr:hypothetical protein [Paenibacillus barcinonensis]QKS59391.1 hypothetical protein HUB98_26430 [Paenibacillus barcinonensis]
MPLNMLPLDMVDEYYKNQNKANPIPPGGGDNKDGKQDEGTKGTDLTGESAGGSES